MDFGFTSISNFLLDLFKNRGKAVLDNYNAELFFSTANNTIIFEYLKLTIELQNHSGYQKLMTGLEATLFDLDYETKHLLGIQRFPIKPSEAIGPKLTKQLTYTFYINDNDEFISALAISKNVVVNVEYYIDNRKRNLEIKNFKFTPIPPTKKKKESLFWTKH